MNENIAKTFVIFILYFAICSCSNKKYDSERPEEYIKYWCNPQNKNFTIHGELSRKSGWYDECDDYR